MTTKSKEIIKVYFVDGSHRTIKTDPSKTTIEELWEMVALKVGLNEEHAPHFFIWGVQDDLELLLYSEDTLEDVYESWDDYLEQWSNGVVEKTQPKTVLKRTFSSATMSKASQLAFDKMSFKTPSVPIFSSISTKTNSQSSIEDPRGFKFLFKQTCIVPLSKERKIKEKKVVHLFYIQAVHNVTESHYPCDVTTAIQLAGLQAHCFLGDNLPEVHKVGHLGKGIFNYVPKHLQDKKTIEQWEEAIFHEHALHKGKDTMITELLYLQLARQWKYYGSTFFYARYKPPTQGFYTQEFAGDVVIGINEFGIHIIDPLAMKVISVEFLKVLDLFSDGKVFSFNEAPENPKSPPRAFAFKTKQGDLINDLVHDWFANLKIESDAIKKERERQEAVRNNGERKDKRKSTKADARTFFGGGKEKKTEDKEEENWN